MKKWNKKVYVFFSLFFILSFLVYPSFSVLAYTATDEPYVPSEVEKQCFYHYAEYDSSGKPLKVRDRYYYGSNGSPAVGYLVPKNDGELYLYVANLGYLRGLEEYTYDVYSYEYYDTDGNGSYEYNRRTGAFDSQLVSADTPYSKLSEGVHMKVFNSYDSAVSFALTGDESGLISESSDELTDSNSVYSPDIGYLQNVQIHTRGVKDDDGETDYLTYDSITNTGFDIAQDGVRVSLYTKYQGYYFENWTEWVGDNNAHKWVSDRKYQKSVDGSSDKFFYEYTKLFDIHADDKAKTESMNQSLLATPFGKIEYWLRIEKKNSDGTWTYGGWVSMADSKASMTEGDKQTKTYDNEENLDPDGGYGTGTDTYQDYGEGNTAEEADEKASELPDSQKDLDNYDSGYETMDSFVDGIKSMKNGLGDVPKIISEVFKALPVPVITAIGCGFFLAIVLRILGR